MPVRSHSPAPCGVLGCAAAHQHGSISSEMDWEAHLWRQVSSSELCQLLS